MPLPDQRLNHQRGKAGQVLASAGMNAVTFHELQVNH